MPNTGAVRLFAGLARGSHERGDAISPPAPKRFGGSNLQVSYNVSLVALVCECGQVIHVTTDGKGGLVDQERDGRTHRCPGPQDTISGEMGEG